MNPIIARYVELSRAVTAAEKSGDFVAAQEAMDNFWSFADKHLFDIPISEVRKADRENNLDFVAFS